jgi:hypothetical protein
MIHNSAPGRNYEYCLYQTWEPGIMTTLPAVTCITNLTNRSGRLKSKILKKPGTISHSSRHYYFVLPPTFFLLVLFLNIRGLG